MNAAPMLNIINVLADISRMSRTDLAEKDYSGKALALFERAVQLAGSMLLNAEEGNAGGDDSDDFKAYLRERQGDYFKDRGELHSTLCELSDMGWHRTPCGVCADAGYVEVAINDGDTFYVNCDECNREPLMKAEVPVNV